MEGEVSVCEAMDGIVQSRSNGWDSADRKEAERKGRRPTGFEGDHRGTNEALLGGDAPFAAMLVLVHVTIHCSPGSNAPKSQQMAETAFHSNQSVCGVFVTGVTSTPHFTLNTWGGLSIPGKRLQEVGRECQGRKRTLPKLLHAF